MFVDQKLTVRVPSKILQNAKRYAAAHNTTLTRLISAYLEADPDRTELLDAAPIVRQLTGSLSADISVEDYQSYLDEKYGSR